MKIKTKMAESEYTLEDFMNEWAEDVYVYVAGEKPDNDFGIAKYPCALTIYDDWLGATYYDAKSEKKLSQVFLTDCLDVVDKLDSAPYQMRTGFVVYNTNKVNKKVLEAIGKQIQDSIGFEEYFRLSKQVEEKILAASSNTRLHASWF